MTRRASRDHCVVAEIRQRALQGKPLNSGANRGDWLYAAAVRCFGSWGSAVEAAGFEYARIKPSALGEDEVLAALRQMVMANGRPRAGDHPKLAAAARRYFGGWRSALQLVGCELRPGTKWTRDRVVAAIRADLSQGLPVYANAMRRRNENLYAAGRRRFGSWAAAVEAARSLDDANGLNAAAGAGGHQAETANQRHIGCETQTRPGQGDPPAERISVYVSSHGSRPTLHRVVNHSQGDAV